MGSSVPTMMIEKCAQMIENSIIPALTDDTIVVQARFAAAILHTFAPLLEERSKEVMEENRGMKEVLANARDVVGGQVRSSDQTWTTLMKSIDHEVEVHEATDVLEENQRLKAVLTNMIKALDALEDQMPAERVAALKGQIHTVLRQQIDHALACLAGGGLQVKT
jgi:hypothetical protein